MVSPPEVIEFENVVKGAEAVSEEGKFHGLKSTHRHDMSVCIYLPQMHELLYRHTSAIRAAGAAALLRRQPSRRRCGAPSLSRFRRSFSTARLNESTSHTNVVINTPAGQMVRNRSHGTWMCLRL